MTWEVVYDARVVSHDLPAIPANMQGRIRRAIESRLATAPDRYGERLRRDLAGAWKLRVGNYRIVFDLHAKLRRVHVLIIAHRSVVYGQISRRRSRR